MRNLLITTIGEYNHVNSWIDNERMFDVALLNYDGHDVRSTLIGDLVWYDSFPTFKYPGIWEIFWNEPSLLKYDYFWMPDDDIKLNTQEINYLFEKARDFDLCQPSILEATDSFVSWDLFKHRAGVDIAYTSFVEITCPLFNRDSLGKCLETFRKSHSGWGLDLAWAKIIGDRGKNLGCIHSVVAKHTRPVKGGDLYNALQDKCIHPAKERRTLMKMYDIPSLNIKEHGYRVLDNNIR